jgi:hypothetical protein
MPARISGKGRFMGESATKDKPCICHVKKSGWPWKATGKTEGGQREEKCRICGATHMVTA